MKKFFALIALVCGLSFSAAASSTNASAQLCGAGCGVGNNTGAYCYATENGRLVQSSDGYWYRCSFTGAGPTGYQWWRIG